jgi:hypothetical protein
MKINQKGRSGIEAELSPGPFLSADGFRWDILTPVAHRFHRFVVAQQSVDQNGTGCFLQPVE